MAPGAIELLLAGERPRHEQRRLAAGEDLGDRAVAGHRDDGAGAGEDRREVGPISFDSHVQPGGLLP
jgi:hypothetical protein